MQTSAAAVRLADMENLFANSFKKMYRDHKMPHNGNVYWCMCKVWRYDFEEYTISQQQHKFKNVNNPFSSDIVLYYWHLGDIVLIVGFSHL